MDKECFKMSCRHYAFRGKHIACKTCSEIVPQPTGKKCMRCGNEIKKYSSGWGGCYNFACLECSRVIESLPKDSIGLTTDANIRYCYWLETGKVMPIEIAESIMGKEYSKFTEEEREYYEQAFSKYIKTEGHTVMGMIGWARKKEGVKYV